MSVTYYQVVDDKEQPIGPLHETIKEARALAESTGDKTAIIEYQYEFSDTELVWTSTGDDQWPPEKKEYGVTWATPHHSVAQTSYELTKGEAVSIAKTDPSIIAHAYPDIQIDGMCEHYPEPCGMLYGRVETTDDAHGEYKVEHERTIKMQLTFRSDPRDGMIHVLNLLKGHTFVVGLSDGTTVIGAIAEAGNTHLILSPMFWALDDKRRAIPYYRIERMEYQS